MPRTARHNQKATLERAAHLFWERGYHACSLKQLETALDMRPGSIYAAFGSKEELFRAALTAYYEQLLEEMTRVLASYDRVLDGLAAYVRQLAAEATTQSGDAPAPVPACMMVKTLLEATTDTPGLQNAVNNLFDRIEQDLTEALERARNQGELVEGVDCARLARLWQAQIIGLRTYAHRRVDAESVRLLAEDMILALQYRTT